MSTRTLLDLADAAEILGVTTRRVSAMVRSGALPTIVLPGDIIRIDAGDLSVWIDAHRVDAPHTEEAAK